MSASSKKNTQEKIEKVEAILTRRKNPDVKKRTELKEEEESDQEESSSELDLSESETDE